jgi:glycosyltransferase involved in cell wall biosynthesis
MPGIVHINKSFVTGGAAIAAYRLFLAQKKLGNFDYNFFAQQNEKRNSEEGVAMAGNGYIWDKMGLVRLALEKFQLLFHERDAGIRFQYSMGNTGINPARYSLLEGANLYHLHWICQGFLSLRGLEFLLRRGKPVVWTLHDMWPFTGGCHYAGDCSQLGKGCGNCPLLRTSGENDISRKQCLKKEAIYQNRKIVFVAPSTWMAQKARLSYLGRKIPCVVIPNALDTDVFAPFPMREARKKAGLPEEGFCLLFGAANVAEERKGFSMLLQAIEYLKTDFPDLSDKIYLAVFGKSRQQYHFPFPVHYFHYISDADKLVALYNAANVFLLPSLEDNLPNTVMEALSCGTPVVAFRSGGVTDMLDHADTGYLVQKGNVREFAQGIASVLSDKKYGIMREKCRKKVVENFSERVVVKKYDELYRQIMKQ